MSQVEFEGVSKRIKGRPIVQNITFQIAPGTIFGLLGPNGAGKTTLCFNARSRHGSIDQGSIYH